MLRLVFLASLLFCSAGWSLTIPEKPANYVNDYAGMFSTQTQQALDQELQTFDKTTSNQIFIATFPSLDGESLEDFSIHLAEKWRAGSAKLNNGIILLFFKNDRKMRMEVGYGLEGAMPDARAGEIIQNIIRPQFQQGHYDAGVTQAVAAMIAATKGEYQRSNPSVNPSSGMLNTLGIIFILFFFGYLGLFFGAIIAFMNLGLPGLALFGLMLIGYFLFRFMLFGRGATFGSTTPQWLSLGTAGRISFGGGSGFGGGGGGSFGGGGASGGW
jgi:uncharacterized protein